MRTILPFLILIFSFFTSFSQSESFSAKRIVNPNTAAGRLRHPFAMVMGPDDSLWVTERRGYVVKVSTLNGGKHQLLNISSQVKFTSTSTSIKQDGMFGIALHPGLNKGTGNDYVYLAHCYDSAGLRRVRIVRYTYNRSVPSLSNPVVLLRGIYGSDDHNGGRLVIGNFGTASVPDYKLLYSVGDRGANQFGNACDSIESQYTPTAAQMAANDFHRYNGKILRLNLDGSIPADNPVINGVRSHIYSYGHRNPQGLAFEKDDAGTLIPNGRLYQSEQGPATNDEVNIITSGMNYGWPRVAGKKDNGWYKYYKWEGTGACSSYPGECSVNQTTLGLPENSFSGTNYQDPIFDLYPGTPPGGSNCNSLTNPTLAPSSIALYAFSNRIPGWKNSLLITTLKTSAVYRLKLTSAGDAALPVLDSVIPYFHDQTALNRYRDIALSADGLSIFLLTDSVGSTSGPTAGQNGGITDRGCILEYRYTGALLAIGDDPGTPANARTEVKVFPNPVTTSLLVQIARNVSKPISYALYDLQGNKVAAGNTLQSNFSIAVGKLSRAVYILKLYSGHDINILTQKVVVQ